MAEENNMNKCETNEKRINEEYDDILEVDGELGEKDSEMENKEDEEKTADADENIIDNADYLELKRKYDAKEKECSEYLDMLKRNMADFDNYRKRIVKEKEAIYDDGVIFTVKQLLPVLDNLERALEFNVEESNFSEGIQMVMKLFRDTLSKIGVEELKAEGEKFNPEYHNAVMHIEDENYGENEVVEVLQKGYKYKDKIIRYSMVKVAN